MNLEEHSEMKGVSTKHNPEFTMIEFYQAYATYEDLMDLIEELVCYVVDNTVGDTLVEYEDKKIDFKRPWKRINIYEALREKLRFRR